MEVLLATGGNPVQQNIAIEWPSAGAYSNGKQLWWTTTSANAQAKNIANGDKLVLALDLAEAVDTEMQMFFTKADDYGIMQLSLDGETLGDPIDFYDVNVVRTEKVSFGRVQLEAGRHELTVDIVGKNASSANYLFGLDNIVFSSQKIDAAILGDAGKISGKQGTSFNVPVQVRSFPEESAMAIEGMITLPDGVEVVDVTPTNSIVYGSFDYSVVDGILRYVFVNTDGSDITVDLRDDTEILTLKLQLSENKVIGDTLRTTATRLTVKDADTFFEYDVSTYESTSIATVISTGAFTATPRELYTGDGIDLIPEGKKAVAIEFTGIDGTEDLTLYGKQLYYSSEKSEKTGKITYVGLVDTDVTLEQMSDTSAYGVSSDPAKLLSFGDTDSDGVLNAQDALAVVSAWLRKTPAPNEFEILVMNVSADSRINSSDAVEIIDKYVSGIDFTVVAK
jgi:hypothetical protein